MNDLATRTVTPTVRAISAKLGVDLPAPVLEALAAADTLKKGHREDPFGEAGAGLEHAIATAMLAGKDPLASKDVQRAALGLQLIEANVPHRLVGYAERLTANAIAEHADAIFDTWRPTVAKVSDILAEFRRYAPTADLDDPNLATNLPTEALTPWGRAKEATSLLTKVAQGWQAVAPLAGIQIPARGGRPLIMADLTLEQVEQLGANAKADTVMQLDVPLDLASTTTYADRVAALAGSLQERQRYADAAPERDREDRRQKLGIRLPMPVGRLGH